MGFVISTPSNYLKYLIFKVQFSGIKYFTKVKLTLNIFYTKYLLRIVPRTENEIKKEKHSIHISMNQGLSAEAIYFCQ